MGSRFVEHCVRIRLRAPPELLQRTCMYNRLINSPFSVVGHDDLQAYRGILRYINLVAELPRTENGKVQKYRLRERGVTPTGWDRSARTR